ncbi:MAG: hypothetical protein P1P90_05270 [Patescibacteria group bacterium]|nr:hypothetical protein [Patescibacteria group bacterium]
MPTKKKAAAKKAAPKKDESHAKGLLAAGLVAGAALAVGTAYYLKTPKGKKMLKDVEKKAFAMQKKLVTELNKQKKLTKENYAEAVGKVMAYYGKTKDIAATEIPEVRDYLLSKWKDVEKEYKETTKTIKKKK